MLYYNTKFHLIYTLWGWKTLHDFCSDFCPDLQWWSPW